MYNKEEFSTLLEKGLSSMKNENGFCINLYEDSDNSITCELVGCDEFTEDDGEWDFEETAVFSRETPFTLFTPKDNKKQTFYKSLQIFADNLNKLVENNPNIQSYLKNKKLAFGFVDGDLYFLGASGQSIVADWE